jgi:hypothetical protein
MEDKVKDGGAAFPSSFRYDLEDWADPGMSLRDWFAGQALGAIVETCGGDNLHGLTRPQLFALRAYQLADAMLAAREPGQ